jgi:molecular chaperone GrpE (heat shock protein)
MPPKLGDRINDLQTKLQQLKAQQQRIDAKARALASRRTREQDTRRKLLVGATVLALVERDVIDHDDLQAWLDAELTREDDRALFDLPPKATDQPPTNKP